MYIILFLILAKEGYAQNNSTLRLLGAGEEIKKHSCYLMTPSSNLDKMASLGEELPGSRGQLTSALVSRGYLQKSL